MKSKQQLKTLSKISSYITKSSKSWQIRFASAPAAGADIIVKIHEKTLKRLYEVLKEQFEVTTQWKDLLRPTASDDKAEQLLTVVFHVIFDKEVAQLRLEVV